MENVSIPRQKAMGRGLTAPAVPGDCSIRRHLMRETVRQLVGVVVIIALFVGLGLLIRWLSRASSRLPDSGRDPQAFSQWIRGERADDAIDEEGKK